MPGIRNNADTRQGECSVTTTPVTQDRDRDTYNWQKRHDAILARNQAIKPDVVIIGDSIVHYWGGEPQAPLVWEAQAWADCFAGLSVENLGFGWDLTENVLWRIVDNLQDRACHACRHVCSFGRRVKLTGGTAREG